MKWMVLLISETPSLSPTPPLFFKIKKETVIKKIVDNYVMK
jgi:hypothetical protein